ncbi:hypothetical protein RvY_03179-3 [Ramazzottius varieornatus]|uniref:Ubiquitin-like modifier-activating enzyme ATG7 n=1 Tax=Ramazzottius varieornatus TaxID=947166 RepID=A0A1D1UM61_RAMVA|nr:hypothetical protein RvY_03179-3 [Ramazzottius varieornatus]
MDDKPGPRVLKFELFASCVSVDFWMTLSKKKLETFGLDASAKRISGSYTTGNSSTVSSRLDVTYDAFDDEKQHSHTLTYPAEGKLLLFNTIEAFRDCDKQQLADQEGALLWTLITSGEALEHPSMLTNFFLAGYADLKKHVYRYWFLFPAVVYPDALVHESEPLEITKIFSKECVENISDFSHRLSHEQNAFLIHQDDASFELFHLRDLPALLSKTGKARNSVVIIAQKPFEYVIEIVSKYVNGITNLGLGEQTGKYPFLVLMADGMRHLGKLSFRVCLLFLPIFIITNFNTLAGMFFRLRYVSAMVQHKKTTQDGPLETFSPSTRTTSVPMLNITVSSWCLSASAF